MPLPTSYATDSSEHFDRSANTTSHMRYIYWFSHMIALWRFLCSPFLLKPWISTFGFCMFWSTACSRPIKARGAQKIVPSIYIYIYNLALTSLSHSSELIKSYKSMVYALSNVAKIYRFVFSLRNSLKDAQKTCSRSGISQKTLFLFENIFIIYELLI